jgi:hypothetical protein
MFSGKWECRVRSLPDLKTHSGPGRFTWAIRCTASMGQTGPVQSAAPSRMVVSGCTSRTSPRRPASPSDPVAIREHVGGLFPGLSSPSRPRLPALVPTDSVKINNALRSDEISWREHFTEQSRFCRPLHPRPPAGPCFHPKGGFNGTVCSSVYERRPWRKRARS